MFVKEAKMTDNSWTPADLLQLSGEYWSTCALHAGVKLDLFTPLTGLSMTATDLAAIVKADSRGLAMLLDALTALNLLDKNPGSYTATAFSAEYLCRTSPGYLGHIILHHHHLMSGWSRLDEAVRSGGPVQKRVSNSDSEEFRESFLMGMFNLAMLIAPRIVRSVDLDGRRRLLDLGGGPGTYAIHFCLENPGLEAVIYDLPSTRCFAKTTIERFTLSDRITFASGDYLAEGIQGRFDVAWLSHILHGEDPAGCAVILEKAVAALEPGGMILVQEFILDDDKKGPLFPALFSLNMLQGTPSGQAYSEGELRRMLEAAGVGKLSRIPLELPNGAGIIAGVRT
jgi:ABC-type transporter Mla MlaB component